MALTVPGTGVSTPIWWRYSGESQKYCHSSSEGAQFENVMSILLNVGSPTLAAYSVTLTTLNSRWIHRQFSRISYPNAKSAARVLDNLQQCRLEVTIDDYVLSSLIVLPENDQYWAELLTFLDVKHSYTWSFANISSTIWVAVAFVLTVLQTFLGELSGLGSVIQLKCSRYRARKTGFEWDRCGICLALAARNRDLLSKRRTQM
jgi:hypothetical protein